MALKVSKKEGGPNMVAKIVVEATMWQGDHAPQENVVSITKT